MRLALQLRRSLKILFVDATSQMEPRLLSPAERPPAAAAAAAALTPAAALAFALTNSRYLRRFANADFQP